MKKIKTLKELRDLFASGELSQEKGDEVWLDNDCAGLHSDTHEWRGDGPEELLEEALNLLGIPNSPV